jgi:hypothetical protein
MPRPLSHNGLIILKIKGSDPRTTYAGLLWEAARKGYRPGWTYNKFKEIFGKKPRPISKVEPMVPDTELREYLTITNNRFAAKMRRQRAKDPLQRFAAAEPAFMTAEDWDVKL